LLAVACKARYSGPLQFCSNFESLSSDFRPPLFQTSYNRFRLGNFWPRPLLAAAILGDRDMGCPANQHRYPGCTWRCVDSMSVHCQQPAGRWGGGELCTLMTGTRPPVYSDSHSAHREEEGGRSAREQPSQNKTVFARLFKMTQLQRITLTFIQPELRSCNESSICHESKGSIYFPELSIQMV
jgi:hypothetical protein